MDRKRTEEEKEGKRDAKRTYKMGMQSDKKKKRGRYGNEMRGRQRNLSLFSKILQKYYKKINTF